MTIDVAARLVEWVRSEPVLPHPGRGRTWDRFETLARTAGEDLSLGRLAEAHADALSILDECGRRAIDDGPYGVWAARSSSGDLKATETPTGWRIDGRKGFCSGAGVLTRALVTADGPDGPRLFDLAVTPSEVTVVPGTWAAVGMAGSVSSSVSFDGVEARNGECVGQAGFYTGRIGFWWGAVGVAACWWGGARALLDAVGQHLASGSGGDHEMAAFGSAVARCRSMEEMLRWAAADIDDDSSDIDRARTTAMLVREVVHDGCVAVLTAAAAAGGARPLCLDEAQSRRSADLYAYIAQHHVGRDAARLGRECLARLGPLH